MKCSGRTTKERQYLSVVWWSVSDVLHDLVNVACILTRLAFRHNEIHNNSQAT